jgi:hypothetical protein
MSSEPPRSSQKPVSIATALLVIVVVVVFGLVAWAATLQRRNKDLERKVAAIEKAAETSKAKVAPQPRKGQAQAPAAAPVARVKKRRRPATATAPAATAPSARKSPVTQPARLITDQELARIEQLQQVTEQRVQQGSATMLDLARARRLLNRAKFLHGDLTREQYQQQSDRLSAEMSAQMTALEQAGLLDSAKQLEFYEHMLAERR